MICLRSTSLCCVRERRLPWDEVSTVVLDSVPTLRATLRPDLKAEAAKHASRFGADYIRPRNTHGNLIACLTGCQVSLIFTECFWTVSCVLPFMAFWTRELLSSTSCPPMRKCLTSSFIYYTFYTCGCRKLDLPSDQTLYVVK